jgi:hypothetical protein
MYGTNTTLDLLATTQQTVAMIGEDHAFDAVEAAMAAQNRIVEDQLKHLAEPTKDRMLRTGAPQYMQMDELGEIGTPDAQKVVAGQNVGFPLRDYGVGIQWTKQYFKKTTGKEFAGQIHAMLAADALQIQKQLKRSLFLSSSYTFYDKLLDYVVLPVKALANADGGQLPAGPNGEIFGGTHTHYLGAANSVLDAVALDPLVTTVLEHFREGVPLVYINQAQEAAVRALSGFTAYIDARIIPRTTADYAAGNLDMVNIYNRAIGLYKGAEVWVKPWIPASYVLAFVGNQLKPLRWRQDIENSGNLTLEYEDDEHPLHAKVWARQFGFGVWSRISAACLYIGGTSYVNPVIT